MLTLVYLIPIQCLFILFSSKKKQASIILKVFSYLISSLYKTVVGCMAVLKRYVLHPDTWNL